MLFLHSSAIAILLSKAFPVQLGIKMTNLSSADFILVLNLTQICMYMYVYVCMINLYAQHSMLVVWSHGLLNFKFTSSTSCVHCGLTMCVDVSTVIAGDVQSDSITKHGSTWYIGMAHVPRHRVHTFEKSHFHFHFQSEPSIFTTPSSHCLCARLPQVWLNFHKQPLR